MRPESIAAWLNDIAAATHLSFPTDDHWKSPNISTKLSTAKRRRHPLSPPMSTDSSKRRRLNPDDDLNEDLDLEQTPRPKTRPRDAAPGPPPARPNPEQAPNPFSNPNPFLISTATPTLHTSQYAQSLSEDASGASFKLPTLSSRAPSSPSKLHAASLEQLFRPVHFKTTYKLGADLPEDTRRLFRELSSVRASVHILPPHLHDCPDLAAEDIHDHMWMDTAQLDAAPTPEQHRWLMTILADSVESANTYRGENAWNTIVHYPLLRGVVSSSGRHDSVQVEPITNAQIASAFRPRWRNSMRQWTGTPSSVASSTGDGSKASDSPSKSAKVSASAHRMVDFALLLKPDSGGQDGLAAAIDRFLESQTRGCATINQSLYPPLQKRPAPVFIETKTDQGTADTANAQLGVWVAAWHERLYHIFQEKRLRQQSCPDRVITLPLIQVIGSTWKVLFAVDRGSEIEILDGDMHIGSTNTIVGLYQLRAAILSICKWLQEDFKKWFLTVLEE